MPSTMLLDPSAWDLLVDGSRNIAVAAEPYALAQDAGSAIKLFEGEDYYDTQRGVPYWEQILGQWPPVRIMKSLWVAAAVTVPNVVAAECFISDFIDRRIIGQVQVTGADGTTATLALTPQQPVVLSQG
jgi:hypothetical protein